MERRAFAVWAVVAGLLVGFIGHMLFYGQTVGLSFPIFAVLVAIVVLASSALSGQKLWLRNLWPLIPLLFFAALVAVRGSEAILTLDALAVLALGALTLYYLPLDRPLDEDPLPEYVAGALDAGVHITFGPFEEIADSWAWLRDKRPKELGPLVAVGRGLLIALPVVLIFAVLLASADAVFGDALDQFLGLLAFDDLGGLMERGFVTLFLGWLGCGAIAFGVARRASLRAVEGPPAEQRDRAEVEANASDDPEAFLSMLDEIAPPAKKKTFKLGMIESGIVLGSVDLLFGVFVLIQFAYFFGGRANVEVGGLTYAEYARRGFFELVAVSVMTLALVLWLDRTTVRQAGRQDHVFRGLAVVMVALTVVMLVSASQRMYLYEDVFGFTHLRVFTHVFMFWLGVAFAFFLLSLFRLKKNVFSLGVLLVLIGYLGTLNLMDVDLYIAERNVARFHEGRELDIGYLSTLSVDAVPAMLALYESGALDDTFDQGRAQDCVGRWLAIRLQEIDDIRNGSNGNLFSANLSRDRAWALLDAVRADLPQDARGVCRYGTTQSREGVLRDATATAVPYDATVTATPVP